MTKKEEKISRAKKIIKALHTLYPDAHCSLTHRNPYQLMVATILSAQCTDARVNMVTPKLFARFKTPKDFASAELSEIEELIRSTGFYKNKAKSLKSNAQSLLEKHNGQVPKTMAELTHLAGVGRKTANVVLGNAFGIPGMVVDTHVTRLSNRMGLAKGEDAVKLEHQLMEVIEKKEWTDFSHLLISHGRAVCMARNPQCDQCGLSKLCPKIGVKVK